MSAELRTSVVIDYQNVHLTARDVFDPGGDDWDSLIEPMQFARRAILVRNQRQRPGFPDATLDRVLVYRGLPHVDHDPEQNRRCLDQKTAWEEAGATVELRDLKYKYRRGADGNPIVDVHGKKETIGRPREKGVDVLCALACVREAARPDIDLVILASRDTDLVPVLDELHDLHFQQPARSAKIETVAWFNKRAKAEGAMSGGSLQPSGGRRIWNTNLDRAGYEASIDRSNYR